MEFFKNKTHYDFIGNRVPAFAVSGLLVFGSIALLMTKGLNYSIDFVGGNVVNLSYAQPVEIGQLRATLEKAGYPDAVPQRFTGTDSYAIRVKARAEEDAGAVERFLTALRAADPGREFTINSQEFVGPTVGRHLYKQALTAIVLSLAGIVVYVGFRFSNPVWGVAGVVALGHDVIATAGLMALLGLEFDLTLVASLLTLAGYSINDTIVIFDRMRERMNFARREGLVELINTSVNETLSRTLITSGMVFITVLTLLFFGGPVIHDFALCMTWGVILGSYSTIFVATPLVYEWETRYGAAAGKPAAHPAPAHEAAKKHPRRHA